MLGTGSWGTTFAQVLADAGHDVVLWGRSEAVCAEVREAHTNSGYVPGVVLPERITATTDARAALAGASLVAVALPSQAVRSILSELPDAVEPDAVVVSLMKGVELTSDERMSELLAEALRVPAARLAVLSGPNLAGEIAQRQPTTTVVASISTETAQRVAHACATDYFRTFTNTDVIGVELGGAVKNVIALAVGIAQGKGYGDNTKASIITRGLSEATRLGVALGASAATFAGLAGMGDLVATCASPLSRNHTLGVHIGAGMSLDEAVAVTGGTAEGAKSCRSVLDLARRHGVTMSITAAVVAVLYEGTSVEDMVRALITRPPRPED
nr:NAD(P)H-dependent glycerol-3-phosphate dehydrogenase [Beutenbergia cavernae]